MKVRITILFEDLHSLLGFHFKVIRDAFNVATIYVCLSVRDTIVVRKLPK